MLVHAMEFPHHARGVGILVLVEPHGIPAMFSPPLPVLDDGSHRKAFGMEARQEFLLRVVPFPAMDVPESPVRHRRHRTAQAAESMHDGIGVPGENGIVNPLGHRTVEGGFRGDPSPAEHGRIPLGPPDFHPVFPGREVCLGRDRGRQPEIGKVHEDLPVHREILFPGHGAANIQQQGVIPVLRKVDFAGIAVETPDFHKIAGCTGHIDRSGFHRSFSEGEGLLSFGGIEFRQSVVVPQKPVSPAGDDQGQGNLGIDLRQAPGQAADIQVAVLELSGTEQRLPFRRHERLCDVISGVAADFRLLQGTAFLFQQHLAAGVLEKEFSL